MTIVSEARVRKIDVVHTTGGGLPLRPVMFDAAPRVGPKVRRDSKREALLRIAREEIATSGFLGTHLAVVAARAGIRKSTLFHYFSDKESLYDAAVTQVLDDLAGSLEVAAGARATYAERRDAFIEELQRHFVRDPVLSRLMLRSLIDEPPAGTLRPSATDRIAALLTQIVELGVVEHQVTRTNAYDAAMSMLTMMCAHHAASTLPVVVPMRDGLMGQTPDMRLGEVKGMVGRALAGEGG